MSGRSFIDVRRRDEDERDVSERVRDWREVQIPLPFEDARAQGSRCMECGVPFCHSSCPLANLIPEWNDFVADGELDAAIDRLHATNNFPEITGRICPAPCEASCVLAIEEAPVTIRSIERVIADAALARGLAPQRPRTRTNHCIAVVGSGPAGLAAAQQLARAGHDVVVYERDALPGGLLRYGIPSFKLDKSVLDARIAQIAAEGVVFRCGVEARADVLESFDAVVLAVGARRPRDLDVPGRSLDGVVFAMDYLAPKRAVSATNARVVVIGGGDTGSDCVGTALRQNAESVLQLEIMPRPPLVRASHNPWPEWPLVFRTSSSHEEGAERDWSLMTLALVDDGSGRVRALEVVRVERRAGRFEPSGDPFEIACDLAILALGFDGPETELAGALEVAIDDRGRIAAPGGRTNVPRVFAAGDASRGQSLVVWAIADGRRAAAAVTNWLASKARSRAS
jgi:glutamate synthase (NADPH/NADH) small chain